MIGMVVSVSAGRNGMSVSLKHTHEIMEAVKGKNANKAITYLQRVLEKKDFIPFRKYPSKGHQHGIPAGFPQKSTKLVIELIKELKSNAKNMGAEEDGVTISSYNLGKGAFPRYRGGGISGKGKRTNLMIFGSTEKSKKVEAPKEEKKQKTGVENKPEQPAKKTETKEEKKPETVVKPEEKETKAPVEKEEKQVEKKEPEKGEQPTKEEKDVTEKDN